MDAARWYLVNRGPDRTIDVDLDLATERARNNAVYYVQYVHARTVGVFREAGGAEPEPMTLSEPLDSEEKDLVKRLLEFPETVRSATERRSPQLITDYAIRLADDFNRFYHDRGRHRIVGSAQQGFRLALTSATQRVIARSRPGRGRGARAHVSHLRDPDPSRE